MTVERLKQLLNYDPHTGKFYWKWRPEDEFSHPKYVIIWNGRFAGKEAGRVVDQGYRVIMHNGKPYRAHRLVFLLHFGEMPNKVDHINGDRLDNRLANLREADDVQNSHNTQKSKRNSSGYKGVSYNKRRRKYTASISCRRKQYHVGYYPTAEDAAFAVAVKRDELHKDYANHG
jgi:hypothetical protein